MQRIKDGANIMQTPFWSKRVEHAGYIQPSVHRRDNQVEAARNFLQRTILLGVVDVVCAEFAASASLLSLVVKAWTSQPHLLANCKAM